MPKEPRKKRAFAQRHDPLEVDMRLQEERGQGRLREQPRSKALKKKKKQGGGGMEDDDADEDADEYVSGDMGKKILKQVVQQQKELNDEYGAEEGGLSGEEEMKGRGGGRSSKSRLQAAHAAMDGEEKDGDKDGDNDEEDDEDDLDNLHDAEEEEIEELEIDEEDEKALEMFMPASNGPRRTLADIIMEKIEEAERKNGNAKHGGGAGAEAIDPKVREVYIQVGRYLNKYTSGKIPKAFKVIPVLKNWEEILHLTAPEEWSPQAMKAATRLFAANLNPKMAQRFYNLVLLPRVRSDIATNKRLNYHLYEAIRKTIYKPAAFFKGVLLPLVDSNCTAREAVIFSSILAKCSIPVLHCSVALLKLAQLPYSGPSTLFMKTILNKKYSLPYKVIDAMVNYFKGFINDDRDLPVIWHQNLLTFAQRYKNELSDEQKETIKFVSKRKVHKAISEEIRREVNTLSL